MRAVPEVLHKEYLQNKPFGEMMLAGLEHRVDEFNEWRNGQLAEEGNALLKGPNGTGQDVNYDGVTVALLSKNNTPDQVEAVVEGLGRQICVSNVEILLINGGNRPMTLQAAKENGVEARHVEPDGTFHAKMLNAGLGAASYKHVFFMPAHAEPASNIMLAAARRRMDEKPYAATRQVAGVYGTPLPGANATNVERFGAYKLGATERVNRWAMTRQGGMGFLDAACSMVDREVVLDLGGYPEVYGNGGADGALGKMMVDERRKNPSLVYEDGALAVHLTRGFGIVRSGLQLISWRRRAQPREYKEWLATSWHPYGGL